MSVTSQQYAVLADHSYHPPTDEERKKGLLVDGVRFRVREYMDRPSGYQGTIYQREDTGEIVVAHRGTEFEGQFLKDLVVTDSTMVMARTNLQANDAIELTQHALQKAKDFGAKPGASTPEVTVTGHSLGGTHAEITAHHFGLRGETFDSFGAVSLNRRIPEGGDKLINHVTATDVVSAASPHYGQVQIYATQEGVERLQEVGDYGNRPSQLDFRRPLPTAIVSLTPAHKMHHFLNVDGEGRPDVSLLADPQARQLAAQYAPMIEKYRGDVGTIRSGASLAGDGLRMFAAGPLPAPQRAAGQIREALQPDLPPGEPARLVAEAARREVEPQASVTPPKSAASGPLPGIGAPLPENSAPQVVPESMRAPASPSAPLPGIGAQRQPAADDITTMATVTVTAPRHGLGGPGGRVKPQDLGDEPQDQPAARQTQAQTFPTDHRDYALFAAIQAQLPKGTPDEKTAEIVQQARLGGIKRSDQLEEMVVENDRAFVYGKTPGTFSDTSLTSPAPAIEQSLQRTQAFDQQQLQMAQQFEEQQARINQSQGGPSMTM